MQHLGNAWVLYLKMKIDGLKVILEIDDVDDLRNLQANRLYVEMRLLYNMVGRIFFPLTERFDWMTKKDIAFMCYLIQGKLIKLPYLMLGQIKEAAKKSRACLPYGMVFTLREDILRRYNEH